MPDTERARGVYLDRASDEPLNLEAIRWCVDQTRIWEAFYDERLAGDNVFAVNYEDLFDADPSSAASVVEAMLTFLSLEPPGDLSLSIETHLGKSNKQTTADVYRRILNRQQIEEAFGVRLA